MNTIIAAGHICIDITPVFPGGRSYGSTADVLGHGKLIRMEGVDVHTGGSVANTGLALKKLGNDVRLLGKIGTDAFGTVVRQILAEYGVSGLLTDEKSRTSYSVVLAVPGNDRIFLHDPGANDTFGSSDIADQALDGARLFHFGYPPVMKNIYGNEGAELVEIFRRAKAKGLATSLDFCDIDPDSEAGSVDWENILRKVLPFVDFFVPSFQELCFMLDRDRYERLEQKGPDMTRALDLNGDALPLADRLLDMGCRVALIKCGVSGMVYKTADRISLEQTGLGLDPEQWADRQGIQPCFRPDVLRSATGAGDTSIAAFLTAVLEGRAPAECAALAAAEGACCVTAYDALSALEPLPELERRIRAGWETLSEQES